VVAGGGWVVVAGDGCVVVAGEAGRWWRESAEMGATSGEEPELTKFLSLVDYNPASATRRLRDADAGVESGGCQGALAQVAAGW
jgi:hypothetical protein